MKTFFRSALVTFALGISSWGMATEVSVVEAKTGPSQDDPDPVLQNYAQVCLTNKTNRSVILNTLWEGVGPAVRTRILAGGSHIYRFIGTGPINGQGRDDDVVLPIALVRKLMVNYRSAGMFGARGEANLDLVASYDASDDCTEMPRYAFMYVETRLGYQLTLVPEPTWVY